MDFGAWGWTGDNNRALEFPAGQSADVAPEGRARIRYNSVSQELELSTDGSAYTLLDNLGPWYRDAPLVLMDYLGDTVVMGALTASGSEKLRVVGDTRLEGDLLVTGIVDPSLRIEEQGSDGAFLGIGPGDTAAVSPAGGLRLRYNSGSNVLEVSTNAGAYGALTVSGWTDDGTVVRLTTVTDNVAIGAAAMSGTEKLRVVGNALIEGTIIALVATKRLVVGDSPYIALALDHAIFADTDGGAITVDLPAGVDGKLYRVVNTGSSGNDVTLSPNGAELLYGANGDLTISDGEVLEVVYETTEGWW